MDSWRFNILSLEEKGEIVFQHSTFLLSYMELGSRSNLYAYENLFIEVKIGHDSESIESIEIVPLSQLNRFLRDVDLPFNH